MLPIQELADDSGQFDIGQLLQYVAPSFNSNRQSGSDGSDHVDSATLRGLGPDQVLVLINGKRRHSSSLVYLFGSRSQQRRHRPQHHRSTLSTDQILRTPPPVRIDAIAGVIASSCAASRAWTSRSARGLTGAATTVRRRSTTTRAGRRGC
jgi:iron complex outermembrane receptor protein